MQDLGQLCCRLVFSLQARQGLQDVFNELDVIAVHSLELHFLQSFMGLCKHAGFRVSTFITYILYVSSECAVVSGSSILKVFLRVKQRQ